MLYNFFFLPMSHRPSFITDLKERKSGKYVQPLDRLIYNVLVLIDRSNNVGQTLVSAKSVALVHLYPTSVNKVSSKLWL